MPYLNWKEASLKQDVAPYVPGSEKMRLSLDVSRALLEELLAVLREVFAGSPGGVLTQAVELRLDLPRNWILFWKLREGESRLLIAHPQSEEWVATAALNAEHASILLQGFEKLGSGQSIEIGSLAPVGNVSNVELKVSLL